MIGIPLGLLYSNAGEWFIHKYVLHGLGKNKKNFWSFHWHEHHRAAREHNQLDPHYHRSLLSWSPQTKEALGLVGIAVAHLPLFPVAPFFTATVWACGLNYYRVHKKSHLDPEWGKKHLPWHVDHHLGPDQNQNWCVTFPWFDWVMGTRKPYVGTEKYAEDQKKRAAKAAAASSDTRIKAKATRVPAESEDDQASG
jgi:hypothetical protein